MDKQLGLYADLYELRMVQSYLRRGMTAPATFSLYIRPAPERPWFVALGVDRVVDVLSTFRYGPEELAYLSTIGIDDATLAWLGAFEPAGEIVAVEDGTIVLAGEPIVEVTAPLPVAQLLETAVINLVHFSTLVATKAARVALAADGPPVVDFGFRRAHGLETGIEAARAAYVGGGFATSNLEAGRRYAIPVTGTMAHSFVQAFEDELDAFRAFAHDSLDSWPDDCVLLVDTYDTLAGVRNAIVVAKELRERGQSLRAIRLDSGDLDALSRAARKMLDDAGCSEVRIFASGGLDEISVSRLVSAGAPVDAFGVGTDLVTSADRPALDISYKLVSYDGRPVAKYSAGKRSLPGEKQIFRTDGPETDVLALRDEDLPGRRLLEPAWRDGVALRRFDLQDARARVAAELAALPDEWKRVSERSEPYRPAVSDALRVLLQR
jgi:nicotinate phosphoribosyltransferase